MVRYLQMPEEITIIQVAKCLPPSRCVFVIWLSESRIGGQQTGYLSAPDYNQGACAHIELYCIVMCLPVHIIFFYFFIFCFILFYILLLIYQEIILFLPCVYHPP